MRKGFSHSSSKFSLSLSLQADFLLLFSLLRHPHPSNHHSSPLFNIPLHREQPSNHFTTSNNPSSNPYLLPSTHHNLLFTSSSTNKPLPLPTHHRKSTTNFEHHHNSPGRFRSKKENIEKMQKKVLQVFSLQPSNYNYAARTTVFYSIVFLFHFLHTWFKHVLSCFSLEIFFIIVVFQSDMLF